VAINIRFTFSRSAQNNDVMYETYGILQAPVSQGQLGALVDRYLTQFPVSVPTPSEVQARRLVLAEAFNASGPATAVVAVEPSVAVGAGLGCPAEVMIAVSRDTQTSRGRRPRGRTYVPMGAAAAQRPSTTLANRMRDWQAAWHQQMQAEGFQPAVIIRVRNKIVLPLVEFEPIVGYSVDDTWDTQRRRDLPSTNRFPGPAIPVLP
jgi:hypothetical protein